MSRPLPPKTYLTLLALASALLILKARRAPKKPLLLKDLKDAAAHVDAGDVTGQPFDSEYDIIIVGGGEFPFVSIRLGPSADDDDHSGTAGCVLAARLSEEPGLRVLLLESGERYARCTV